MVKRVTCTACQGLPYSQAKYCHECKGVGFIEYRGRCAHPNEDYEVMCNGWFCPDCGDSGPLTDRIIAEIEAKKAAKLISGRKQTISKKQKVIDAKL